MVEKLVRLAFFLSLFGLTDVFAPASSWGQQPPTPEGYYRIALNGHNFTLPEGFTIEMVAKSPQVDRPVTLALGPAGKLYVADSSGSNANPHDQLVHPTHRIVCLQSTRNDGNYDKSTVFADKLSFLQGTLWFEGSLYVGAPPRILKLTDTDDDGVADQRETWFDGKTLTGCANDLHGPYRGLDGLIYWTKGAFAQQKVHLKSGQELTTRAAHVFRAKPDGSAIEVLMTGGMDNPVGLAFLPEGDVFCSCTFVQHPGHGKRDGIIHCTYGAIFGKDHPPIHEQIWADTQFTEPMTHLGPAAPAGLHAYRSGAFGKQYVHNLFCAQFNRARVSRHVLKKKGSTFETLDSDFVVSDNRDFHPTDVVEDVDGSLLITDTGGWYKLCCPSSVYEKKDVLGAIYRVRKIKPDPLIKGQEAAKVVPDLRSSDLHARRWAAAQIGQSKNPQKIPALLQALEDERNDPALNQALVRALIDLNDAEAIRAGLSLKSSGQRGALIALAQLTNGKLEYSELVPFLTVPDAHLRDAAWSIAFRRPDWSLALAKEFERCVFTSPAQDAPIWEDHLKSYAGRTEFQEMLLRHADQPRTLLALGAAKPKELAPGWLPLFAKILAAKDSKPETIETILGLLTPPLISPEIKESLQTITKTTSFPETVRLKAASLRAGQLDRETFRFVLDSLSAEKPGNIRGLATELLLRADLSDNQRVELAKVLPKVSPLELMRLLEVFQKSIKLEVGQALVRSLSDTKVRAGLRSEMLKPILAGYGAELKPAIAQLYRQLDEARKNERDLLDKIRKELPAGDGRRGQAVFSSSKASCTACHKIEYVGGTIGPDLTRIGSIRSEMDLLESIVFPSASFVRSYEPVKISMRDGKSWSGTVKSESETTVELILNATEEIRIARKDIDTMIPGTVSIMPAGLDQQINRQELADLLAFLLSRK